MLLDCCWCILGTASLCTTCVTSTLKIRLNCNLSMTSHLDHKSVGHEAMTHVRADDLQASLIDVLRRAIDVADVAYDRFVLRGQFGAWNDIIPLHNTNQQYKTAVVNYPLGKYSRGYIYAK